MFLLNSLVKNVITQNVVRHFTATTMFFIWLLLPIANQAAYAPSLKWHTIETPHFLIHYHTGLKSAADEVASLTPDIHNEVTQYFNWVPKEKTHIVISDKTERPNGTASVYPYNRIELFMTPPSDIGGLEDFQNWKKLLLKHEYVHIVHLDKAADFPLQGRDIIGRYFLFFPNTFSPRWISEGIAIFSETDKNLETGRGQSNYYRGLMRNELIHGFKSLNQISQFRSEWPSGTSLYLYGAYFFNFINDTYGKESIADFVEQYSEFPAPYFINTVAKKTFGKSIFELWEDFEVYLNKEFHAEIQAYKNDSGKEKEKINITKSSNYSGFSQLSNGKLYFIRSNRESIKELVEKNMASNKEKVITSIVRQDGIFPQSFDVHSISGILIPLLDKYENYRASFDLYNINAKTGKRTRLTTDKRYIRAVWNTEGNKIIALGNSNGLHRLDLLSAEGAFIKTLWQGKSGTVINAFDWSPINGTLVVSQFTADKGWNLALFSINNGSWRNLTNNSAIETYPQFNATGTHIIYTADYDGIYNAYQLEIETNEIIQLTNSKTIALFPTIDRKNKNIFFTELGKDGFNLIVDKIQKVAFNRNYITPQSFEFFRDSVNTGIIKDNLERPYSGLSYTAPTWLMPKYIVDENQTSLGFLTQSSDPINWHTYQMELLYDVKNLEFRWDVSYLNQKHTILYAISSRQQSFNSAFFERRDTETAVAFILPLLKQKYRWQLFSSLQEVQSQYSLPQSPYSLTFKDTNIITGISLDSTSQNLFSASPHNGVTASLSYGVNTLQSALAQHSRIQLYGGAFSSPIKRAIFEASGTVIAAGNDAKKTYLGGSASLGFSDPAFGKNTFLLYGYKLNQFINTNMQKISVKMHYPIYYPDTGFFRFPLGINRFIFNAMAERARVGTFSTINSQLWLDSIAMELNAQANFGFGRYPFSLTAGIAKGLSDSGESIVYKNFSVDF